MSKHDYWKVFDHIHTALRKLLSPALPRGTEVSFAGPAVVAQRSATSTLVDFFLYDVHEDMTARLLDWTDVRDEHGRVVARKPPPRQFRMSYLVTAWDENADEEHTVLGRLLTILCTHAVIPADLAGPLANDHGSVLLDIGNPNLSRYPVELWQALGVQARSGLNLTVTASVVGMPVTDLSPAPEIIDLGVAGGDSGAPEAKTVTSAPPQKRIRETN